MDWSAAYPAVISAFLASTVEIVEAFTIVLVVATLRGLRPALVGTGAALAVLALIVAILGPLLGSIPITVLQLVIGILLLLFGMGWLRKATLRAGGIIPLHNEAEVYAKEQDALSRTGGSSADWIAGLAAFKAVLLEGLEVAFIVVAVGAGRGLIWPAAGGALLACVIVLCVGAIVHKPLTRVPENTLKLAVGVMLSAFGVFWTGEGLGVEWPGADAALVLFAAIFLAASLATAKTIRTAPEEVTK